MASNFRGIGSFGAVDPVSGLWTPMRIDTFNVAGTTNNEDILSFPLGDCGPLQVIDQKEGVQTYEVTVGANAIDNDGNLEVIFNERFADVAAIDLPVVVVETVPASGVVPVPGMTAGSTAYATIVNDTTADVRLTAGTASATQFTRGTNEITLDAQFAGNTVSVYHLVPQTNVRMIGGPNSGNNISELSMFGVVCTNKGSFRIWMPRLKRESGLAVDPLADAAELTYKALTPAAFGEKPYAVW